jgi:predicted FMN-binding regulatory protein PaiB
LEIQVEKIDAIFKLNQNKVSADREGVIAGLETRADDMSREIRRLMIQLQK